MKHFFHFRKLIFTDIIKVIYVLGLIGVTFIGLTFISLGGMINYAISLSIITVGNIAWRLLCEGLIILFTINKNLEEIKKKIKR